MGFPALVTPTAAEAVLVFDLDGLFRRLPAVARAKVTWTRPRIDAGLGRLLNDPLDDALLDEVAQELLEPVLALSQAAIQASGCGACSERLGEPKSPAPQNPWSTSVSKRLGRFSFSSVRWARMPRRPSDADEKKPIREARPRDAGTSRRRPKYGKEEKLAIFAQLFRGRDDVYPARWENTRRGTSGYMPDCSNKFVESVCHIKTTKCGQCPNQALKKLDQRAIEKHLQGRHTVGVYPLMVDGICWFLALDFDARTWTADVRAVRDALHAPRRPCVH